MAGRPITNNSPRAQKKRERMRRVRAALKTPPMPVNPQPLADALAQWRQS